LKKLLVGGIAVTAVACAAFALWWLRSPRPPKFDTAYQAVLLDNGQVYYGKIDRIDSEFSVMTDVYYIQSQVDAQTKGMKNILVRRGNEWHAPNRSVINTRHIVVVEPVIPGSKVAELITQLKNKNQ
jgi:hypothetical protein